MCSIIYLFMKNSNSKVLIEIMDFTFELQ